jgi:cell division protein FtsA
LRVLGLGQTAARGVKSGAVVDVNEAECAIRVAVDAAERMAQTSISKVMVSFSGGRPQTHCRMGMTRTQTGVVGPGDLEMATSQALTGADLRRRSILHLHPVNHALDGQGQIVEPLGLHGDDLRVEIGLTTVEHSFLRNISLAMERAHLEPAGFVLASYAAGKAALTPDEMELGAVLIDIGGAVTSLAFVRGGKLVAADSIALGGLHLTNDVAQGLSTSIAHAERMKTLFGNVLCGGHGEHELLAAPLLGERGADAMQKIPKSLLNNILRARADEMLEHISARLQSQAFAASAGSKIVLTGGAGQLAGLRELASHVLLRPVRLGQAAALNGLSENMRNAGLAAASGALIYGANPDRHYALPAAARNALQRAHMGYARRVGQWLAEAL